MVSSSDCEQPERNAATAATTGRPGPSSVEQFLYSGRKGSSIQQSRHLNPEAVRVQQVHQEQQRLLEQQVRKKFMSAKVRGYESGK